MVAAALRHNFGLRIDRYVVIHFGAFEAAVDAIGGIEVEVPRAIYDTAYPAPGGGTMAVDIPAGWVHLDGAAALIYARTRHQDSDFARMRRQQDILLAIRDKLFSAEVLPYLPGLAQVSLDLARTDLMLEEVGLLGCAGVGIGPEGITRLTIDGSLTTPYTTREGAAVLKPVMEKILPLLDLFNSGE